MNTETIKAIVRACVIIVVAFCGAIGIDVDGDLLTNVVCSAIMLISTGYGVWKNHNFTEAAQRGQELIDEIKGGE